MRVSLSRSRIRVRVNVRVRARVRVRVRVRIRVRVRVRVRVRLAEAVRQLARRRRHVHRQARCAEEELGAREHLDHARRTPMRLVLGERDVVRSHLEREADLEAVDLRRELHRHAGREFFTRRRCALEAVLARRRLGERLQLLLVRRAEDGA